MQGARGELHFLERIIGGGSEEYMRTAYPKHREILLEDCGMPQCSGAPTPAEAGGRGAGAELASGGPSTAQPGNQVGKVMSTAA